MHTPNEKYSLLKKTSKRGAMSLDKYLNSIINIPRLGSEVYSKDEVKNLFDVNNIDQEDRYKTEHQYLYLEELLKATTPNYKSTSKAFTFNSNDRVGWILLEFNINTSLSKENNIKYINEYIQAEVGIEPTLITIQEDIIIVGYLFPNPPTTLQIDRLKKYRFFRDVRTALTHSLEANWDVTIDNYNQTKIYSNFLDGTFYLSGNIFEIGVFQEMLNTYKDSPMFEKIIKQKKVYGGQKSGVTKRAMTQTERMALLESANEKRSLLSKYKFEDTVEHIKMTESIPKFTISNIVKVSKELFDRGLSNRTVASYLNSSNTYDF